MRIDDLHIGRGEKIALQHFARLGELSLLSAKVGIYDCEIPDILDYLLGQELIKPVKIPEINGYRETYQLTKHGKSILRQLEIPFYKRASVWIALGTALTALFTGILAFKALW